MKISRLVISVIVFSIYCFSLFFGNISLVQAQSLSVEPSNCPIRGGQKVTVSWTGMPAGWWDGVGIFRPTEEGPINSAYYLTFGGTFSGKSSGQHEFPIPIEEGEYEIRYCSDTQTNGFKEVLTRTRLFLYWPKVTFTNTHHHKIGPQKFITVNYSNASGFYHDYVGLYKVGEDKLYRHFHQVIGPVGGGYSGTIKLNAPEEPGTYEFRYMVCIDNKTCLHKLTGTSMPFTVQWGSVSMRVTVSNPNAQGKRKLTVQYSGAPGYAKDWIGFFPSGAAERGWVSYQYLNGNTSGTLEFDCPDDTKSYEFRMWANDWTHLLGKTQPFIPKNGPPPPLEQQPDPPPPPAPDKPFTLRAYPGDGKVFLEWTPPQNTSNIIGYNLYRKTSRIPYGSPITDFPVKGLNHMDHNVDNGMQACYYVKAVYNDKTESAASNEVCVTPNAPKATINIPANATTTQSSYTFTGKVPPGSTVTVNGTSVTVGSDGSFTATVQLQPGKNTITVTVKTKTGETITSTHTVTLTTGKDGKIIIVLTIGSKNAYVNQQLVVLDVAPFIDSGRTFVPFRFVGESLGAEVGFTTDTSGRVATVTYRLGSTNIILYIGRKDALVNGRTVYLDVAPKIVQGRTVIPLRFVTEALGCKVDWDGQAMKVTIQYPA